MENVKLDELDFELLRALASSGKASLKELGGLLGVPASTVHARIKRLEREQVIKGYSVVIDHKRLGLELLGFVMVRFQGEEGLDQERVAHEISKLPRVQEVFILAGEFDILLRVRARSIDDLGDLVVKQLKEIRGVGQTLTYIVLRAVKESGNCIC